MPKIKPIIARTPAALAETLGLQAADAKEWEVQHALLGKLKAIVKQQNLTHAYVAKKAGSSRPRITAILNDNLEHVSSDLLIRILTSLGYRVRVLVEPRRIAA